MKTIVVIVGILIATFGGVITYRALYTEPRTAVLVTNTEVKELPNYKKVVGGSLLFVSGAVIAFLAARRISKV